MKLMQDTYLEAWALSCCPVCGFLIEVGAPIRMVPSMLEGYQVAVHPGCR